MELSESQSVRLEMYRSLAVKGSAPTHRLTQVIEDGHTKYLHGDPRCKIQIPADPNSYKGKPNLKAACPGFVVDEASGGVDFDSDGSERQTGGLTGGLGDVELNLLAACDHSLDFRAVLLEMCRSDRDLRNGRQVSGNKEASGRHGRRLSVFQSQPADTR
ncbi:hypothetical protein EYF80_014645 [Liparis tanakae]|uniref:Uncharacterized protein n=1 Tax=Liparis tanakae TaxID=230148 RepID=A0A4Z2ICD0_9TELE|nr:hypothetical protein EYF80_014645 [Liparis tanakae]